MNALLQFGLINAAAATGLALLAGLAGRLLRHPPLTRALWVLVLLKLLTPPLWHVRIPGRDLTTRVADVPVVEKLEPVASLRDDLAVSLEVPAESSRIATPSSYPPIPPTRTHRAAWRDSLRSWPTIVTTVWLSGITVHLVLLTVAIIRLRRLARCAKPADAATRGRAAELAAQLGLRRCPEVSFVCGAYSPMLCAIGTRPRLLLPPKLWERLDSRQRDTVLTHELAHLRRGDHRVRMLEVIATAVYWWHPVVWYARRALREASEQCCDAWVLWALPRSATSYASALIETVDYISVARPAVPALASGMGQFTNLKRRLIMIRQGTARRALSRPVFGGVCAAAAVLLPLAPGFGQVATDTTAAESRTTAVAPAAADTVPGGTTSETTTSASIPGRTATAGVGSADVVAPENVSPKLEAARREVDRARAQLERAEERLARLEGRPGARTSTWTSTSDQAAEHGRGRSTAANGTPSVEASAGRIGIIARDDQQQRLDALENQVRQILNELRQMKREQRGSRSQSEGETLAK